VKKELIISLVLLLPICSAQLVDVFVEEDFKYDIVLSEYSNIDNLFAFSSEFFNPGSSGYRVRVRMDILNGTEPISIGWSSEKALYPGGRENFMVYWLPENESGELTAKVRFYFNNEILGLDDFTFTAKQTNPERAIDIKKIKVYDDRIVFKLKSDLPIEKIIIIPKDFPSGWIVDQQTIKNIEKGKTYTVELLYEPSLWRESEARIFVVSGDGNYYGEQTFTLEREKGISRFCYLFKQFIHQIL
jgi:hypothetical protein